MGLREWDSIEFLKSSAVMSGFFDVVCSSNGFDFYEVSRRRCRVNVPSISRIAEAGSGTDRTLL